MVVFQTLPGMSRRSGEVGGFMVGRRVDIACVQETSTPGGEVVVQSG